MTDRPALVQALGTFVAMVNCEAPDAALRAAARILAPIVTQIVTDADDETAAEVRLLLAEIFKPEESPDEKSNSI